MGVYGESPHGDQVEPTFWRQLSQYAAYFLLWLAYAAISLWLVFQYQVIAVAVAIRFRVNPWQVRAMDLFATTAYFLVWLIGILLVEHYLRRGVGAGQLWRRAGRVFLATLIVVGVTAGIMWVLT